MSAAGAGEQGAQGCKPSRFNPPLCGWMGGCLGGSMLPVPELFCGPGLGPLAHSYIMCVMAC